MSKLVVKSKIGYYGYVMLSYLTKEEQIAVHDVTFGLTTWKDCVSSVPFLKTDDLFRRTISDRGYVPPHPVAIPKEIVDDERIILLEYVDVLRSYAPRGFIEQCDGVLIRRDLRDFLWEVFEESDSVPPEGNESLYPRDWIRQLATLKDSRFEYLSRHAIRLCDALDNGSVLEALELLN